MTLSMQPGSDRRPPGSSPDASTQSFRRAGDLHEILAFTASLTAPRQVTRYVNDIFSLTNPSFGPLLSQPTISVLGSTPVRLRAAGTWQAVPANGTERISAQRIGSITP